MSENIMYKNIADKMKKESLETIKDSYDETMPKQEFERSLKYIEDYITNLQQENEELNNSITWWNNRYNALQRDYEDYKSRCEKAVEIYDETITYLTTINGEYMDSNTKKTIQDVVNKLEKQLDILNGRSDE